MKTRRLPLLVGVISLLVLSTLAPNAAGLTLAAAAGSDNLPGPHTGFTYPSR